MRKDIEYEPHQDFEPEAPIVETQPDILTQSVKDRGRQPKYVHLSPVVIAPGAEDLPFHESQIIERTAEPPLVEASYPPPLIGERQVIAQAVFEGQKPRRRNKCWRSHGKTTTVFGRELRQSGVLLSLDTASGESRFDSQREGKRPAKLRKGNVEAGDFPHNSYQHWAMDDIKPNSTIRLKNARKRGTTLARRVTENRGVRIPKPASSFNLYLNPRGPLPWQQEARRGVR